MRCTGCGTENPPRVKFCSECGGPMGVPCPYCGQRNPADAADCGGCGRSLQAQKTPAAERRQVTVFFADIVGSTKLAESLDPEDLHDLYARYQALCAEVLHRYEGHIAQYLGDGILAYFGYPAAHEDDPARAVRSGLEILERIGSITLKGHRPQLRIGIHTGLVVVGDVGAGVRHEQLALGEAPNVASRLQSEALPDTIVVSDATRTLLAGQFALEDLGSRTLKGVSRPTQIFRVLGRSGASSRFHAMTAARGLTPFVGRERELDSIRSAWTEAVAGGGRTLLLRGEAGMGKSRLLEAAAGLAAERLHEVFEAECSPYQMNSPLHPVLEMIGNRVGLEAHMSPERKLDLFEQFAAGRGMQLAEAAMALATLFSVPATNRYPEIEMPPAKRLQWMIGAVAEMLLHAVDGSPVLILIEDLHWADPSTVDLLGEIVARQPSLRVLLICTSRPEFPSPWSDLPHCREIRVGSLPPADTRTLVSRVVGRKPLPLGLVEELVARTGGIPLFVEAVTRTVVEAGILRELDDRYELTGPLPSGLIPATVQSSLMGRIDRLGADRAVAQLAATIGRESNFELLQAVLGVPTQTLAGALRRLVELDLVAESGEPPASTYTFKHALIQDAAYESLLRKTRQEFHGKIAEALVHRFPEMAETSPEMLARHYEGAGRMREATAGWMKAGLRAQRRSALRECIAYMQKAVSLLETLPADDPARLQSEMEAQLALSTALMSTIGWGSPEVEAACIRARHLCERLGNTNGLMGSLWGLWTVYFLRGAIPSSFEVASSVLEMALASQDPGLQIAARQALGNSTYFLGRFAEACEHGEKARVLYDSEREKDLVAVFQLPLSFGCANYQALSLWLMGYPDRAEQARRRGWAVIEALNMPPTTVYGLGVSMMLFFARRDVEVVARQSEELYAAAAEGGYLFWIAWARMHRGWAQAMLGSPETGIAEMQAGLQSYGLTGSALMMPQWMLMLAEAQLRASRPGEALASLSRGIAHVEEFQEHVHEPELHRLRGEVLIAQGAGGAGEASLNRAIEIARAQQAKMLERRAAIALAKLRRGQGRVAEARALLQAMAEWFQEGLDGPELCETRAILQSLDGGSAPMPAAANS